MKKIALNKDKVLKSAFDLIGRVVEFQIPSGKSYVATISCICFNPEADTEKEESDVRVMISLGGLYLYELKWKDIGCWSSVFKNTAGLFVETGQTGNLLLIGD